MGAPLAIEDGFVTRLATITGLHTSDERPGPVLPPHAWPELVGDEGLITFGGDDAVWLYDLYLVVPAQKSRAAARATLGPYLARAGAQSVYAALFADPTLNGAAAGIRNFTLTQHPKIEVGDGEFYGAVWRVEVMA